MKKKPMTPVQIKARKVGLLRERRAIEDKLYRRHNRINELQREVHELETRDIAAEKELRALGLKPR